ncbi:MAG: ATP-binding cassette domain-containing protein, partial [Aquiluna sp.]
MTAAITFTSLAKTYGKQQAVAGLSIEIQKGRITGFLGPNGAGKSTALRCLVGLAKPTSGSATILGAGYRDLRDPIRQVGC